MSENQEIEPYKEDVHEAFLFWFALPDSERSRTGAKTMQEFAEQHGVNEKTLTRWKQTDGFLDRVFRLRGEWEDDGLAGLLDGWKIACMKGNVRAIELWLAYFEGFNKDKMQPKPRPVELTENDIRVLINYLPEEKRKEYYGYLAMLHDEASYYKRLREEEIYRAAE